MLRVLRVLQIQANRLWTWLEGEAEESEEEEEEEEEAADDGDEEEEEEEEEEDDDVPLTPHGKKQARGTVKREHSEDEPDDVPEKHSSSASKTTVPTQPKSRHYTHIMTISSDKHKRQTVTNYKQHKNIVPHDSTTGSHPSNHPHPLIAHSTATQQQHRRTTQSGHRQQSPVRSSRQTKHNKQPAKQRYQRSRKAGIKPT